MWIARLVEAQAGIRISGRSINNLRCADDTTLMAESEEEQRSSWWGERREWKSWLKAQHSKTTDHGIRSYHFLANRWGNNGNSDRLYFFGSKITVDCDCNHEIRRCLLLGRKAMTNLDSIFNNRDITLPTKIHIVKAVVFPVVTYGFKSWTVKKAEHKKVDAFELWCWRRLLRVPWITRRSNQS